MITKEILSQNFSDEEMARDWTLSDNDKNEVRKYRKNFRLLIAIQICAIRVYARFVKEVNDLSPRIVNYLNGQLGLPPSLSVQVPEREATLIEHRKNILDYLGFRKFDEDAQNQLKSWLEKQANQRKLPDELLQQAESHLLATRVVLPGRTVLERLVISVCSTEQEKIFESLYQQLSPEIKRAIDDLLSVPEGEQRSYFYQLKEYPPAAKISSLKSYLQRYQTLLQTGINELDGQIIDASYLDYLFRLAKQYSTKDIKRFKKPKQYALMLCFLVETQKIVLDYLVKMHDQYLMEISRESKNVHEKMYRAFRRQQKKAIDDILELTDTFFDWPDEQPRMKKDFLTNEHGLRGAVQVLRKFKKLSERGYGDILIRRYPSLRKYFAEFIHLPFYAEQGNEGLLEAIKIIRQLDAGEIKQLPEDTPAAFVPKELRKALKDANGKINRNAWEMAVAFAIKNACRSGDLFLPKSKRHVSFWDLVLNESVWLEEREDSYVEFEHPQQADAKTTLSQQFHTSVDQAKELFVNDDFAEIQNGDLRLKRVDKAVIPTRVTALQKAINASMPSIRIERLLMAVDRMTNFSRHFVPVQHHESRPKNFYKALMAAIISQATNLGIVSMCASVKGISVDMLRHILQFYIREETLKAASEEIVNQHHMLPLSAIHGNGTISSSDGQRFKIRADSLLASYYPRYYGYYEKAIGIYTHVSDQYAVFNTKIISCGPREALYVLDGLLENNTILKISQHTTDTHGYTEIIFALCYLLGFYFMPRIRDLKDQQLYRIDKNVDYGIFTPLLNKTADINIVEEQWDSMIHVAHSLKKRTAPAHVIVQRLTNGSPADRLSKAFTNLGRIIKTEYILRYITDPKLRRLIQLQLNKGEYRHKLPRWIFFANQGEFTVGDYEEIMNKATCLSLVSNAILYWNTIKINGIVEDFRSQGENIDNDTLSHISLLPFKHVLPNGAYFIEGED